MEPTEPTLNEHTFSYEELTVELLGKDDTRWLASSSNKGVLLGVLLTRFNQNTPIEIDFTNQHYLIGTLNGTINTIKESKTIDFASETEHYEKG